MKVTKPAPKPLNHATVLRRKIGRRRIKVTGGPSKSAHEARLVRLMRRAVEVLESAENARKWLTSPQFGLGGAVPLEYAETEFGVQEIEDLLGRIELGVYS